jgi:hypothetical protein
MSKKTLDDILAESDELGLLANLKPVAAPASSEDHRVRQKFEEINAFIDRYGRQPGHLELVIRLHLPRRCFNLR